MPAFQIRDLPRLMRENRRNTLVAFARDGAKSQRTHAEVYQDVCACVAHLRAQGFRLGADARLLVCGEPGYAWLLAALACLYTGTELVALPETLNDEEVQASLAGMPVEQALLDDKFMPCRAFADVHRQPLAFSPETLLSYACVEDFEHSPRAQLIAFTSGSTAGAKLKMFRVDLESSAHFIDSFTRIFGLTHDDLWLVCHSFSHIVHLEYVLGGLGWGYDVALTDVLRLLTTGARLQPSVLVTVPSVYEQLAQLIRRRQALQHDDEAQIAALLEQRWQRHLQGEASTLLPEAAAVIGSRIKMMLIGAAPSAASLKQYLLSVGLPVFEGYGLSELNMVACNTPQRRRHGSVGPLWPELEARIDDEGVLCVRPQFHRTDAYLNVDAEENAATFMADGWVNTGDLAEIDDGFIHIVGRKKEIIVSSGGKNINAAAIEARLREISGVAHALVYGDRRPFLTAVFAPHAGAAPPSEHALREALDAINRNAPMHERVLAFVRLEHALDVESGLLTRSGKPRRQVIEQRMQRDIQACYE